MSAKPQERATRRYREPERHQMVLGSGNCWCGRASSHNWPGKADGQPHPREMDPMGDLIAVQSDCDAAVILDCGHSATLLTESVPYFGSLFREGKETYCQHCPAVRDMWQIAAVIVRTPAWLQRQHRGGWQ